MLFWHQVGTNRLVLLLHGPLGLALACRYRGLK